MAEVPPAPAPAHVPAPLPFPAFPLPRTNETDFDHVLEHVKNLTTIAQRARIMMMAGVTTAEDLLYIDKESLLEAVTTSTTIKGPEEMGGGTGDTRNSNQYQRIHARRMQKNTARAVQDRQEQARRETVGQNEASEIRWQGTTLGTVQEGIGCTLEPNKEQERDPVILCSER